MKTIKQPQGNEKILYDLVDKGVIIGMENSYKIVEEAIRIGSEPLKLLKHMINKLKTEVRL